MRLRVTTQIRKRLTSVIPADQCHFLRSPALIEHKADANYDAVATRMAAMLGVAFVAHVGMIVVQALSGRVTINCSSSCPFLCCTQHTVGYSRGRPSCSQGARRRRHRPFAHNPSRSEGHRPGGSKRGIGGGFDFITRPPITVRSAPRRCPRCTYILAVRAAKTSRRPSENVGDTAHDTGNQNQEKDRPALRADGFEFPRRARSALGAPVDRDLQLVLDSRCGTLQAARETFRGHRPRLPG